MGAIVVPQAGEFYVGDRPAIAKVARVTIGIGSDVDVATSAQTVYPIFDIPADTMILEMRSIVLTAFTASVTLDIGDGSDADGWLATAKVAPTSAVSTGIHKRSTLATAEAYAGGKLYTAADTIDVAVTAGGGTAGRFRLACVFRPFANRNPVA